MKIYNIYIYIFYDYEKIKIYLFDLFMIEDFKKISFLFKIELYNSEIEKITLQDL